MSPFALFQFDFLLYPALDTAYDGVGFFFFFFFFFFFNSFCFFLNIFKFLVQFVNSKGHFIQ